MAKSKSYGGLIFLLIVVLGGGASIWYYFNGSTEKQPEFSTTKVARGDITQAVTATGDLQPVVTVDVGAQVSGEIKEVRVDFNSKVKAGDVLALIDQATPVQKLKQAEADLESAKANNLLTKLNADRTRDLLKKNLVSQQELDAADAQLAQSNATQLTRTAAVENARLDVSRCTITAPIDGMVLNRNTDKGRTVNASMNSPTLFTLVNDLTKMQINAAVAEADVGTISEGQNVMFTVDAFPNRPFKGVVRQVRNAATVQSSVVSYATIIDVTNEDLKLKPGMTASVSIIVSQRPGVLRVANSALRVRLPQELQPKAPAVADGDTGEKSGKAGATAITDDERRNAVRSIMREAGVQPGQPPTPEMMEKAMKLAKEKGVDPEMVTLMASFSGASGAGKTGSKGRRGSGGAGAADRGFNNTIVTRTLYKFADPDAKERKLEAVSVRLGISDGFYTEVLEGLNENDTIIASVRMPGAVAATAGQSSGGSSNPFQGGSRGFSSSGRTH